MQAFRRGGLDGAMQFLADHWTILRPPIGARLGRCARSGEPHFRNLSNEDQADRR